MKISVCIDTNAWDFLFHNNIDIKNEFPTEEFQLYITREIEIEIEAIPDFGKDGGSKLPLKQFIRENLERHKVKKSMSFGFAEANPIDGPANYGGFGEGTFQSLEERSWHQQEKVKKLTMHKSKKKSGLHGNQADAAVAAQSFVSIVLTCDQKGGPILEASKQGGKVIFLTVDLLNNKSLSEIVRLKSLQ